MLFNSYAFIFCFLPVVLVGFGAISRLENGRSRILWLLGASLFFYGWWNPNYLLLIGASIGFNYTIGRSFGAFARNRHKGLLVVGICTNLAALGYFKYANFFVDNLNWALGSDYHLRTIILPLAISFFTFQQIAYLVDAYRAGGLKHGLLEYALFVSFFPQLIAGPIVHHQDVMPQLNDLRLDYETFARGMSMFALGLFKKLLIADSLISSVDGTFSASALGQSVTFADAWMGTIAYSLQLYFDFSGYSDMAIGLGALFGVTLPLNFNSPYKATSVVEFWRRWHMTLSRFLRDYVYIALGGNRLGTMRRYVNLMMTMLLGGLWHGAGWTFVLWGAIHGAYLIVGHLSLGLRAAQPEARPSMIRTWVARTATFLAILVAWVVFRAESLPSAFGLLATMFGFEGFVFELLQTPGEDVPLIIGMLALAWFAPNTQEVMATEVKVPLLDSGRVLSRPQWQPSFRWAMVVATLLVVSVASLSELSEFLYFQF